MVSKEKFDPYGLPDEVSADSNGLVFVLGLTPTTDPKHAPVWDALSHQPRSPDHAPLHYSLHLDHTTLQLPPTKQKRQSYEWYTPKGVLKSNWLKKYQEEVPAVIVVFHELDWMDPLWAEKKVKLLEIVNCARCAIGSRSCRIAVVLLQSSTSSPSSPDPATAATVTDDGSNSVFRERATSLCSACELPDKHLFILPLTDTSLLPGYTARLDGALSDIAGGFYLGLTKNVRAHRDYLNKNNHQLLFVRHNFKIGFLSEMRSDLQSAIKAYLQSYQHLADLRYTDTNLHELRIAAAIINYKVCQVNFLLNLPRDAIAQFRRHIDLFRPRMGPKLLLFEHYAWLANQYEKFGSLFERAVSQGLPAVQTQHPGFYYQQAAQFAALRRTTALHLCSEATDTHLNLLSDWHALEIYGQRPWRPGKHSLEPPESEREENGTEAVQYREYNTVKHSELILPLYSRAIAQFQRYKCPRIKQQLMASMATEYHKAGDHKKALTVLQHVAWQYRSERWWSLVSAISMLALHCAYLTADVVSYVAISLEILGSKITLPQDTKARLFNSGLLGVLRGVPPEPHSSITQADLDSAKRNWEEKFAASPDVSVDLGVISSCIEVRASFLSKSSRAYSSNSVTLYCHNSFTVPLTINKLTVTIEPHKSIGSSSVQPSTGNDVTGPSSPPNYSAAATIIVSPSPLIVSPGCVSRVELPFIPAPLADPFKCYKITGVSCTLLPLPQNDNASLPSVSVVLQWPGAGNEGVTAALPANTPRHSSFSLVSDDEFTSTPLITELEVKSRDPLLDVRVDYDSTALVWEWLLVRVSVTSNERSTATNLKLGLNLKQPSTQALEQTTQVCSSVGACSAVSSEACSPALKDVSLPELSPGESHSTTLYVKCLTATVRHFTLSLRYDTSITVPSSAAGAKEEEVICPCHYTAPITVTSKIPFQVEVWCEDLSFERITQVTAGADFLLTPLIRSTSHVPITITHSKLLLMPGVSVADASTTGEAGGGGGCVAGVSLLEADEMAEDCHSVSVLSSTPAASQLLLGHYLLHWRRSDAASPPVSMSVALPTVAVEECGVIVGAVLPPHTSLYTPTHVTYTLTNNTPHSVECLAVLEQSQQFMFAGNQQVRVRVLSGERECLELLLYPTCCGEQPLPRLNLSIDTANKTKVSTQYRVPPHLLVKPRDKLGCVSSSPALQPLQQTAA